MIVLRHRDLDRVCTHQPTLGHKVGCFPHEGSGPGPHAAVVSVAQHGPIERNRVHKAVKPDAAALPHRLYPSGVFGITKAVGDAIAAIAVGLDADQRERRLLIARFLVCDGDVDTVDHQMLRLGHIRPLERCEESANGHLVGISPSVDADDDRGSDEDQHDPDDPPRPQPIPPPEHGQESKAASVHPEPAHSSPAHIRSGASIPNRSSPAARTSRVASHRPRRETRTSPSDFRIGHCS